MGELAARLARHARREDELLYRVADAASDETLRESLTGYLTETYLLLRKVTVDD